MRFLLLLITCGLASTTARAQQNVTVAAINPPERLAGAVLGEWNTDGNLENWSGTNVTDLASNSGVLTGSDTDPAADAVITLAPLSAGPDLDFGFFDYLQIRLKLPAAYTGDVRFDYGTSTRNGFDTARSFVIPAASIIKDGHFHTYRLDLGLEVFWRDSLRDLRITPIIDDTGGFEIDYIEVGDVPGTAPELNLATNFLAPLNADNTIRLESKHFCIWWDPNNPAFTLTHARRALRMNEESYQVFVKKLGYNEPFRTFDSDTTPRYKINHITWYGGFWAGGWDSRGHMNIGVSGLLDEGWGNPVPHEFAHVIQMGQSGRMVGGHWESHANYLRARRNLHFFDVIPGVIPAIDNLTGNSNYRPDHKRFIYHDQRYYLPLDDFGTNFGLPADFTASVWRDGPRDRTLIEKIAAMLPLEVSVKDVAAEACKHWPMLDFVEKDRIRQQHWGTTANRLLHFWRQGAQLVPLQDKPGWWRVPPERAPDSWGYQMHVLDATPGSTITTELRGIDKAGTGEDWRWCFAAISPGDNVRYSPVHPPGTQSFTLNPDESQVFLIVTATPDEVVLDLETFHNRKPTDKHPDRRRFNYEVRLVNASPAPNRYAAANPSGFRIHGNGGGVVGPSATVSASAYVGPHAKVLGTARVEANARIEDYAVVQGNSRVRGNAIVSGFAMIEGNALVESDARIRDRAHLVSGAVVRGRALVCGYTRIENTTVTDDAIVRGNAHPFGGTVSGTAILDHDSSMYFDLSDGVHFNHIPWGGWWNENQAQNQRKPRGLVASYRAAEPDGEEWWDEFGALHAQLRGAPSRTNDIATNSNIIHFDGSDDFAILDRSLGDTRHFTFSAWLRPAAAPGTTMPILFMGRSATQALRLDRNAAGQAAFSISDGSTTAALTGNSVLAENQWNHLAIQLDGTTVRLYVNGIQQASTATTLTPLSVLAANDHTSQQANYLARDWAGSLFHGAIDDARFFNVALSPAEIREEMHRRAAMLGQFSPRVATDFDGTSTTAQSGVPNGRVRTLSAWVRPRSSDDVSNYEAVFDSRDERSGSTSGSGLGLDNGRWTARLDGLGLWNTNVTATMNEWQHVALAFDGSTATLFINGSQVATRSYSGPATDADAAGKTYRIGYSQTTTDTNSRQFFDGEILNARIFDRALVAAQIILDSDGDGFNDPVEAAAGSDPLDPASVPVQYPASGSVTDSNGTPLAGATLSFRDSPGTGSAPLFTITTDANGQFSTDVLGGNWHITATAENHYSSSEILVSITSGVSDLEFALSPYTTISGTVTGTADGTPLDGATVSFAPAPSGPPAFTTTSQPNGGFSMPLPAGAWFVRASATGFLRSTAQQIELSIDNSSTFNFALEPTSYSLIEDFEHYTLGTFNGTTNATEVWNSQSVSPTIFVAVQDDGSTRHLAQGWTSGNRGGARAVSPIPQGEKGVFHFRIRTTTGTPDATFGLSDIPSGTAFSFGDFEAQVYLIGNAGTIELGARNGGSYQRLTTGLATNTWYDLWLVIDNGADTYDVHFGTSANPNTPGPRLAKGLGFRNGNAANPLGTFLSLSNQQADLATHLDDIHYSADAAHIADITILADIGTDAANGNNQNTSTLAAAQLNAISGVTGAIAENETAYRIAIAANTASFSNPATVGQVQAMIDAVNALPPPTSVPLILVNGDFETGIDRSAIIEGWTDSAPATPGFWLANDNSPGSAPDPTEAQGGSLLYLSANRLTGGASSQPASSTLSQTVPLAPLPLATVVTGTAQLELEFHYFDVDDADTSNVTVDFLDASGQTINTLGTGTLPNTAPNGTPYNPVTAPWTRVGLTGLVPAGTTAIRINIQTNRTSGSATNVHFDSFTATLFATSPPDPDTLLLARIGADAAGGTNTHTAALTAAELNSIAGVSSAIAANEAACRTYISGNPSAFDYPATTAQVQAMIDEVNASILASNPPVVTQLGFNPAGGFELSVSGLNPSRTYRLMRGNDLTGFPNEVLRKQPATTIDAFTDPTPPAGKAFYRVELASDP